MAVMRSPSVSKRTPEWIDWLRRIPYLQGLSSDALATLAEACSLRHVPTGGSVFEEGAAPTGIFLLLAGRVRVVRMSPRGREQVLHEDGPGATLGEVPVFDGEGYVGTAIAADRCTLLFVPRAALLARIDAAPEAARQVIAVLSRRVRRFAGLVADLSLRGSTERVAAHLLREMLRTGGDTLLLTLTREQLASHLSTVREQVSRALSELRDQGVLEVEGRRIRVRDLPRLRQCAGERV
jgi:CRP/FNR family transcriptional regulator, dissimilatory nitrate respiration regulator